MKPAMIVWGQGLSSTSSAGKKQQFTVRAIGQGCLGNIQVLHFELKSFTHSIF